jgi:hypothetical protein
MAQMMLLTPQMLARSWATLASWHCTTQRRGLCSHEITRFSYLRWQEKDRVNFYITSCKNLGSQHVMLVVLVVLCSPRHVVVPNLLYFTNPSISAGKLMYEGHSSFEDFLVRQDPQTLSSLARFASLTIFEQNLRYERQNPKAWGFLRVRFCLLPKRGTMPNSSANVRA